MIVIDKSYDSNSASLSLLTTMKLSNYLDLSEYAFKENGNIEGQRRVISKSASASKIRERMIRDFKSGSIFPSVVLGIIITEQKIKELAESDEIQKDFEALIDECDKEKISIIDGMQRTNIYNNCKTDNENRDIRVEYWITSSINSLLYRMLVLNTGQVPWNIRRQVEVIYKPIVSTIEEILKDSYEDLYQKLKFFAVNENGRRTQSGEFHKNQLIDLFLAYNLRSEKTNISTQLAEEYKKIDLMNSLDSSLNIEMFVKLFVQLCNLDLALGDLDLSNVELEGKFTEGKSLFSSHPVRIGFIVAATELVIGRVGRDKSSQQAEEALNLIEKNINEFISKVNPENHSLEEIESFLAFGVLNEWVNSLPKSNVGEAERVGFKKAFTMLLEEKEELLNLSEYWRNL